MKEKGHYTLREVVKQYYSGEDIYEQYADEADKILENIDDEEILNKCREALMQKEKKAWHIGRLAVSKVACVMGVIILAVSLTGVVAISAYMHSIKVVEKGDHSEIEFIDSDSIRKGALETMEDYYKPKWIPDGYHIISEFKYEKGYEIIYKLDDSDNQICYSQTLPFVNTKFSTEGYEGNKVTFGKYAGEYIETKNGNFLIVTDGTYLYSIIANSLNMDTMIKMLN